MDKREPRFADAGFFWRVRLAPERRGGGQTYPPARAAGHGLTGPPQAPSRSDAQGRAEGTETGGGTQLRVIASASMKRVFVAVGVGLAPGGVFSAATQERTPIRHFTWPHPLPFPDTEGRTVPRREVRAPCLLREDDTNRRNMPASPGTEAGVRKRSSRRRGHASRKRKAT